MKLIEDLIPQREVDKEVAAVLKWILLMSRPQRIYLFGSALDGGFKANSDFDFLIIFATSEECKSGKKILQG